MSKKKTGLTKRQIDSIRRKMKSGSIYRDPRYVKWRKKVFERDRYVCQLSGEAGGHLEAHHIIPKSDRPDLIFDLDNGITLRKIEHEWLHENNFVLKYKEKFQKLAKTNKPRPKLIKSARKIKKR